MNRTKLAYRVLRSLSLRVGLVVFCGAVLGLWHLQGILERNTVENITIANREWAERESVVFDLAQKNHELLKAEILKELREGIDPRKVARFDSLLTRYPDGTIRNRKNLYDGTMNAGVFIPPGHPVTPEFKSFIVTLMEIAETYGKTFRSQFQDTYFTTPDNVMVIFWPESPNWTMEMKADFDMTKEEYVWVADATHDPEKETVWTGLFYDKVGSTWMTSGETPIYEGDRQILTIGHDLMLAELTNRIATMKDDGSYSFILRPDGRLVAHPSKQADLKAREGKYDVASDPYLKDLHAQILLGPDATRHPSTRDLLVHSEIHGPGWLLVTVYPDSLIVADAFKGIGFVLGLALLSLMVEMIVLYLVLEREVNRPLEELSAAAEAIRAGKQVDLQLASRSDELGQFAATFTAMSAAITERDRALQEHAESLEAKVKERTRQLEDQRAISIQQAKMASLGEMAGGMAHEINNPLATISLTIHHSMDLLEEPKIDRDLIRKNLERMLSTSDRIAKIVRGLRSFSRSANKDPMQKVPLQLILRDTLSLCGEKMKSHGVELRVDEGPQVDVVCRATEISQVILNLLNNAYDAVDKLEEKWIDLRVSLVGQDRVWVRITDSGKGIPPEVTAKIMQPFFTTKEVGKGTGLGLSIAKGITETHGGQLFVDTESANTSFVLDLPLA